MNAGSLSQTIILRPMTLQDTARVHEIDRLSFPMPWSERSYRFELTENKKSITWVAEAPGGAPDTPPLVVGMIVIWAIIDEAHVATIAAHPNYRGLGIGRRLLARGLLTAVERGARMAYLEVRRSNLAAQKLYEQFGFEIVGVRPRYYKDNDEDALLMTLEPMDPLRLDQLVSRQ